MYRSAALQDFFQCGSDHCLSDQRQIGYLFAIICQEDSFCKATSTALLHMLQTPCFPPKRKLLPLLCWEQIPKLGLPWKVWKESDSSDQYWKSIVWTHVLLGLEARNSMIILNSEPSTQRVNASLAQLYRPCFSRTCCEWVNKHRGRPSKTCQETIVQYNWSRISIKQLIEGGFCLTLTTLSCDSG